MNEIEKYLETKEEAKKKTLEKLEEIEKFIDELAEENKRLKEKIKNE